MFWGATQLVCFNQRLFEKYVIFYIYNYIGGHATAAITQYLVKNGKPLPQIQVLIYPWVQMFSFLHPSSIYYDQRDFISNAKFPIGRYLMWLIGIKDNISEEMENIFISNNHTLLLEDKYLRKKYESYVDINLVPEKYKNGKIYYDIYKNRKTNKHSAFPNKLDSSNILVKNKDLSEKIKVLLKEEANPGLANSDLLKQLPKAYFLIVEWDCLKDQGLIFAERLKSSGVQVKVNFYENAYHGMVPFIDASSGYNLARVMFEDLVNYINENL